MFRNTHDGINQADNNRYYQSVQDDDTLKIQKPTMSHVNISATELLYQANLNEVGLSKVFVPLEFAPGEAFQFGPKLRSLR